MFGSLWGQSRAGKWKNIQNKIDVNMIKIRICFCLCLPQSLSMHIALISKVSCAMMTSFSSETEFLNKCITTNQKLSAQRVTKLLPTSKFLCWLSGKAIGRSGIKIMAIINSFFGGWHLTPKYLSLFERILKRFVREDFPPPKTQRPTLLEKVLCAKAAISDSRWEN